MTQQEIRESITKIDKALASPYTPPGSMDMLRQKKVEFQGKLKEHKEVTQKLKKKSTPAAQKPALKEAKKKIETAGDKLIKEANSILEKLKLKNPGAAAFNEGRSEKELTTDSRRKANKPGKHISKSGKTYYEERANRTDFSQEERLECGARIKKMITGGSVSDIQSSRLKEIYNYLSQEIGLVFDSYVGIHRYSAANESIYSSVLTPEKELPVFIMLTYFPGTDNLVYSIWEGTSGSEADMYSMEQFGPYHSSHESKLKDDIAANLVKYENDDRDAKEIAKYIYDGETYTASQLIDFADTSAEYDRRDVMENGDNPDDFKIKNVDQAIEFLGKDDVTIETMKFARGGRPKSALMRDRKYKSLEPWEQRYIRKGETRHYVYYKADGGPVNTDYYETHTAAQLWNDWTETQREHFLTDHFPYLPTSPKFPTATELLQNFYPNNLDPWEQKLYDDFKKDGSKVETLQLIINSVGGDYSQLDETLAEIAVLRDQEQKITFKMAKMSFDQLEDSIQQAVNVHRLCGQYDFGGAIVPGVAKNINVFGYETLNFDICPQASEELLKAVGIINFGSTSPKIYKDRSSALRNLSETADDIFALQKKIMGSGAVNKKQADKLISDLTLAGVYNYKAGTVIHLNFLSDSLYEIIRCYAK